jgi:addiction module RelE/StbE family toxin
VEVAFSKSFKKSFKKRIKGEVKENLFWECLQLFIENPFDDRLQTHKLSGKLKNLWSFKVEFDIRVVFYFTKDKPKKANLVDIGSHDEVY